ncbi:toll-interacting protein-like [Leptopilina boulardi]|uniref:toll-interacting protein-like n=1 Tax=Leptopilina boulardi TaxID=63433 RepID=UPI0021F60203|nr:toll-interacting protein-like [Leptopilina boulardi]
MGTVKHSEQFEEWKKKAFIGPLPSGFLRLDDVNTLAQQEAADRQAALALHQAQMRNMPMQANDPRVGRLSITITQAKLVKNYGMTRMDPYVRLRVGHAVYETHTAINGGKNPHWNKVIQCLLPPGITQIYVEIYDECSFTMDELIAWGHIDIPSQVIQRGETYEDWYLLSGKQGDHQEGSINLVLSYTNKYVPHPQMMAPPFMVVPSPTVFGRGVPYAPVNVYTAPPTAGTQPVPASTLPQAEEELKQIAEMFPNIDKDVIKSVYDTKGGQRATTINTLLQMNE